MYLKRLHMQGFKSFPDKLDISFGDGITAIVGPNGSGKSNISDAVRWVLGEQSYKTLRGSKMEDIIFGGTEKRAPVGVTEVSIIIDNSKGIIKSEFNEIMITRKYFRSGESEFFINKKVARLKDIHEFFMDTGLGRDGYSMIGQGKVDEILSLKSEDRREIFEEAAGITKYRYKKGETEKRLVATEENLIRICDILSGLEQRRDQLEKQSKKAKKYLFLYDSLKNIEISVWLRDIKVFSGDVESVLGKLDVCKQDAVKLYTKNDEDRLSIDQVTADIQKNQAMKDDIHRDMSKCQQDLSKILQDRAVLKESIRNSKENHNNLALDIESLNEKGSEILGQIRHYDNNLAQIDKKIDTTSKEKGELESRKCSEEYLSQSVNKSLGDLRNWQNTLENTVSGDTEQERSLNLTLSREFEIQDDIDNQLMHLDEENSKHALEVSRNNIIKERLLTSIEKSDSISLAFQTKIESLKDKSLALQKRQAERKIEINDISNRIKMLDEMQKHFDGYPKVIKMIMSQSGKDMLKGIYGPVSSLVKTDTRYITAVETSLASSATYIVINTAQNAKRSMEYLKKQQLGRATFLPIDRIKPINLSNGDKLQKEKGFIAICADVVECDKRFSDIIYNLLGRTVIAEDIDCAMDISKKNGSKFRIVTLDGQVINAGGSMTGGSVMKSLGSLSRNHEIERLKGILPKLQGEYDKEDAKLEKVRSDLADSEYKYKVEKDEQNKRQQQLAGVSSTLEKLKESKIVILAQHASLYIQKENSQKAVDGCNIKIINNRKKLKVYNSNLQTIKSKIESIIGENQDSGHRIEELNRSIALIDDEILNLLTSKTKNKATIDQCNKMLDMIIQEQRNKQEMLTKFAESISDLESQLEKTVKQERQYQQKYQELGLQFENCKQGNIQLEAKRTRISRDMGDTSHQIVSLEREISRIMAQKSELDVKKRQIYDKLWEKYDMTPAEACKQCGVVALGDNSDEDMFKLRAQIKALGPVNVDAIEEYENVLSEFNFTKEQKDDIEDAKLQLIKTIDELTDNMKTIFTDKFKMLNKHFGEVFREIFNGGSAELILEDTSDVLNCGIDIKACPPGKTLKTLTLLSGGERAFVAIALYFAILKAKPAPFVFLDEIEAALDDVNVARFAKYIRKLSNDTQFIVITHRRGTMEEADMLYGVTMQNQGISKLLMLNVNDVEREFSIKI